MSTNCDLYIGLKNVKIGPYTDRSCIIGPISDPEDLKRIEALIVDNYQWLDKKAGGIIRIAEGIVEPTIISKPLKNGGNYSEFFAPVFFIQEYEKDQDLALYFENKNYAKNAMNVSLYGKSVYIENLIGKSIDGKLLHNKDTFLHNTHLHALCVERGTQPYGGCGYGASSISINGHITPMPTLPQRDIYEQLIEPILDKNLYQALKEKLDFFTELQYKNIEKLLKLPINKNNDEQYQDIQANNQEYFDIHSVKLDGPRYVKIDKDYNTFNLLIEPNTEIITSLKQEDIRLINLLKVLLNKKSKMTQDEFRFELYAIPKELNETEENNKIFQLLFFKNIYKLLFGKSSGPQLAVFLWDVPFESIENLFYV